jgi:hypothetical protein
VLSLSSEIHGEIVNECRISQPWLVSQMEIKKETVVQLGNGDTCSVQF